MRIIVLFNLKPGTDRSAYEAWARATDIPVVNGLPSIERFTVHRATGVLGSEAPPPYAYVEVIDVKDAGQFGADVGTATMAAVAAQFQSFADNPTFIVTEPVA